MRAVPSMVSNASVAPLGAPLGTWLISWYDTADCLVCRAYVDDCARKVTIVFDYLDRTPDDEGIKIFKNF